MRITIREINVETEDATQAATLIAAWRNGTAQPALKARPKKVKQLLALPAAPPQPDVMVSPQLTETWEWLVAHDLRAGRTIDEVTTGLRINKFTAQYRLQEMVKKGLAHRVTPGHYRRGEK